MFFPPGEYYIGDACYVLHDSAYDVERPPEFWEQLYRREPVEYTINGVPLWEARTAYGDGAYHDNDDRWYSVDGGRIGVVPVQLCVPARLAETVAQGLGHILTFVEGFEPHWEAGVYTFGPTVINTRGEEDEA